MKFNLNKNRIKRLEKQMNLLCLKRKWRDSDVLKYILLDIDPYSKYARLGVMKALKHAIKLLKKEENESR